ncbi:MAG: hypothetical protein C0434_17675 [Xanthomonadaceae bacterium]|nr:hypothetical protein [Xanthomonadaceae bacterium]
MSTMNIPESLIERAKAITGQTRREAAIRAVIELAEAAGAAKSKARPKAAAAKPVPLAQTPAVVRESEREFRAGKGKRFKSAKAATAWLES